MALFGLVACHNEASRYLQSVLRWHRPMLDDILVYDDRSDDDSVEIATDSGCRVVVRSEEATSFAEHEGMFRQQAYNAFEAICKPTVRDWVLAFDCDEMLVDQEGRHESGSGGVLGTLRGACLKTSTAAGVVIPIPEVFDWLGGIGRPLVRKDGYWGQIRAPRLYRYQTGGRFKNQVLGCGSVPTYVTSGRLSSENYGLRLLHFGYAEAQDRVQKYERYNNHPEHGHNNAHIQSILGAPALENYLGQVPDIWRGVK